MRRFPAAVALVALVALAAALSGTSAPAKKRAAAKRRIVPPPVTAAQRAAARDEIALRLRTEDLRIENAEALSPFYNALLPEARLAQPVHILQFGDSHTASDDWVDSMRILLQARYGDGGPGFVQAGRPYRGYRRFDARGNNSPGWFTEGTMALRGDENQGLSGVSISTSSAGQTVTLRATGEVFSVLYLRQPGGGAVELTEGDKTLGSIDTNGEAGAGITSYSLPPDEIMHGDHELTLRTLSRAPVRLFGWVVENKSGLTFETLGINGAQANVMLGWSELLWTATVAQRHPALVILAYGTNEANSPKWTAEQYRADLEGVIQRVRRAILPAAGQDVSHAGILMIGPPDCGKAHALANLPEVIALQREIAREQHVAFWDWRRHMGGPGAMRRWVTAGYAQADYIHMTSEGYRMVGEMIATALLENPPGETR